MNPTTSYVICSMPRSGTHLLGEALQNTGRAGRPDEYFICDHQGQMENQFGNIAELYGKKTLEEFRELVTELGSSPNGVFGITIMGGYFHTVLDNYRVLPQYQDMGDYDLMNALLYTPQYIWLIRKDKVRQAVSIVKALQTNVWRKQTHSDDEVEHTPIFDFDKIDFYYNRILSAEAEWELYFKKNNIVPFKIAYEDLVQNYEQTAVEILNFLNLPADNLTFASRQLKRQANRSNDEWVSQYHAIRQSQAQTGLSGLKQRVVRKINAIISTLIIF